ncbi:thiamine diphosphate-binding protein [Terfezia boudieri ATCC MYA-4762]|uniref:Thiamine diphosphate-binding protein n=1 Tax=Terfezia boudieri ATCC MYA-4762 TaxID=1051890 RepID=A0A3N4LS98_9PEZI|nr:thiamine diphosphate-binding protein [Terfezia boudieri ATCC MYA-4762]
MMLRQNVKHIYEYIGYAGGSILPVFDAIYNSSLLRVHPPPARERCRTYGPGQGYAAGYARASGKPEVVIVPSGPDALSDGTPLVVLFGQVPSTAIGTEEADVTRGCTEWNVRVKNIAELPQRINEAFDIATSSHPGPVLVNLLKMSLLKVIPILPSLPAKPISAKGASRRELEATIKRVSHLINIAKKPVIYTGQSVIYRAEEPVLLKVLVDKAVTTTLHDWPTLGTRFDDCVTGSVEPAAKAAATEGRGGMCTTRLWPRISIQLSRLPRQCVEVDVADNLAALLPHIKDVTARPECRGTCNGLINPQVVIEDLSKQNTHMKNKTIITTGQRQMWTAQHYRWRHPRPVLRFNMILTEMSTIAQFDIGVKVKGMVVTQWQTLFHEKRYSHTHQKNSDFVKLSGAMGVPAIRATKPEELAGKIKQLLERKGPMLLEVMVDKKMPVSPMVPAGKALHEFLVYDHWF